MQCGNVMGFWSVMKHEDYITKGCFSMKTGHCCQLAEVLLVSSRYSNFSAALILKSMLLSFRIETLSSRYFGLLIAMLRSRLSFLSKVEAQLDHRMGIKPKAPCGAMDGNEKGLGNI